MFYRYFLRVRSFTCESLMPSTTLLVRHYYNPISQGITLRFRKWYDLSKGSRLLSDSQDCDFPKVLNPTLWVKRQTLTGASPWGDGSNFRQLFSSVQSLSREQLFSTPWSAVCQASLSITNSRSLPKLKSVKSVRPSNHLILCRPLRPPSIFPSIRVFSNESVLCIRWPKYWSFSFSISLSGF